MKTILILTDLGPDSSNLLVFANQLGKATGAKMHYFHATEGDIKEAEELLQEAVNQANPVGTSSDANPIHVQSTTFSTELITDIARELGADLIVMATHVREGLRKTFFESRVTSLIEALPCPVLLIPSGHNPGLVRSVGYASELFDLPERLREIVPLARLLDAHIDVFHVYPVFPEEVNVVAYPVNETLEALQREHRYERISLHFVKTSSDNDVLGGIREFIQTNKPDLLVMCHRPRGLFDKLVFDAGTTFGLAENPGIPLLALSEKTACRIM